MSWLQKRPQVAQPSLFYTAGLNKTVLVVGLGNPGQEYEGTRHNIGFSAVDHFTKAIDEFSGWVSKKDLKAEFCDAQMADKKVICLKPTTFMNNSGEAVMLAANFYKIDPSNILVLHDELDINFGQIRTRVGGSDAGHNGVKSITKALGSDNYGRIRIGIGPKKPVQIDSKEFVLAPFTKAEKEQLPNLYKEVAALLSEHLYGGNDLPAETRSFIV